MNQTTYDFSAKRVLITGASQGIGAAIAQQFLAAGARCILASRSKPDYLPHENAHWIATDLADPAQIESLFDQLETAFGGLDVLINNAGVQLAKTVDTTTDEDWQWLSNINMRAPFMCCRRAVQIMKKQGNGAIVNIGSIGGITADHELAIYNASKAWMHGLTKAIATDHGKHGIRCNAVCPTWTLTEMSTEFFDAEPDSAAARQGVSRRHPLQRLAQPEEIAQACLWLASDQASFISGQLLSVDGGMTASSAVDPVIDISGVQT